MAVAQLVEHLIAIQKVAGSNPVSHSTVVRKILVENEIDVALSTCWREKKEAIVTADITPTDHMVTVVQLVRTPDCGSGGRQFESARSPHRQTQQIYFYTKRLFWD